MNPNDPKTSLLITNDDIQLTAEYVVKLSQDKSKPFNVETVAEVIAQCLVACTVVNENTP